MDLISAIISRIYMSVELVRLKVQFILYHKSLLIRKIIRCNEYSSMNKIKKKKKDPLNTTF